MQRLTVKVFVATMTGCAELLAEDLASEYEDVCDLELELFEEAEFGDFVKPKIVLIVSSTYGVGEVPEPTKVLYTRIDEEKPVLAEMNYGVISLGDSTYHKSFARGGELWDELFARCGARRLGNILKLDANSPDEPLESARIWFESWLEAVRAELSDNACLNTSNLAGGR